MTAIRRVVDMLGLNCLPLLVSFRKAHDDRRQGGARKPRRIAPRVLIRCGCCKQRVEVCVDEHPTGDPHVDMLEINGVYGSIDQWRQVLLPLLGVPMPDAERREARLALVRRRMVNDGRMREAGDCRSCGDPAEEPEGEDVPAGLCSECQDMQKKGWLSNTEPSRPLVPRASDRREPLTRSGPAYSLYDPARQG